MFTLLNTIVVAKKKNEYCSFPDIIQSKKDPNKLFLVYREGTAHHPEKSTLVLMRSKNKGKTWKETHKFPFSLKKNGIVWNCPRLSYMDNDDSLNIICDTKDGTVEREARFRTYLLKSFNDGGIFNLVKTPLIGMVPDKIIPFKDKLFLGNHKIKSIKNDLIQLVNWSKDGEMWYDCNIVANSQDRQYCEGSFINVDDQYLVSYLRDNTWHFKSIYYTKSEDGINWSDPEALGNIMGQRVTAIRDDDIVIGAYRNTREICVSLFYHPIGEENKVERFDIESEYRENLYHFGYTGIIKISKDTFAVAYYIKNDEKSPFIKIAFIKRN